MVHEDLANWSYLTGKLRQVYRAIFVMMIFFLFLLLVRAHLRLLPLVALYRGSLMETMLGMLLDACRQGSAGLLDTLLGRL